MSSVHGDTRGTGFGELRGTKKSAADAGLSDKVADKKQKLAKFGMKFQSAGTLISIGDNMIERDTPLCKDITPIVQEWQEEMEGREVQRESRKVKIGGVTIDVGQKASYTTMWEKAGEGGKKNNAAPLPSSLDKAPPPLMSRQRELIMEKAADLDNSDDEDADFTAKAIVKKPAAFKFKITKR